MLPYPPAPGLFTSSLLKKIAFKVPASARTSRPAQPALPQQLGASSECSLHATLGFGVTSLVAPLNLFKAEQRLRCTDSPQ